MAPLVATGTNPASNRVPGVFQRKRASWSLSSSVVVARVAGVIERIAFEEGISVKTGQVLAEVDSERYRLLVASADAAHERAMAARSEAQATYDRRMQLAKKDPGLVSKEELVGIIARVDAGNAEVLQARAALGLAQRGDQRLQRHGGRAQADDVEHALLDAAFDLSGDARGTRLGREGRERHLPPRRRRHGRVVRSGEQGLHSGEFTTRHLALMMALAVVEQCGPLR